MSKGIPDSDSGPQSTPSHSSEVVERRTGEDRSEEDGGVRIEEEGGRVVLVADILEPTGDGRTIVDAKQAATGRAPDPPPPPLLSSVPNRLESTSCDVVWLSQSSSGIWESSSVSKRPPSCFNRNPAGQISGVFAEVNASNSGILIVFVTTVLVV